MTKLEELKAAYEAATKGEWDYFIASNRVYVPNGAEGQHDLRRPHRAEGLA